MALVADGREVGIDPLVSIPVVAKWLNVHENTVYRMISRGDLIAYKVKSRTKVSCASVHSYLALNRVDSQGAELPS
jgi:excisionase family DNA binding protein